MKLTTTGKAIALMLPTVLTMAYVLIIGFIRMPEFATSSLDFQLKFVAYHTGTLIIYITLATLAIWYAAVKNRLLVSITLLAIALFLGAGSYFASQDSDVTDHSVAEMPSTEDKLAKGGAGYSVTRKSISHLTPEPEIDMISLEILTETANQANKLLPMMLDEETEHLSITPKKGELVHHYRMIKRSKAEFGENIIQNSAKPYMVNFQCTTKNKRLLLDKGLADTIKFYDKDMIFIDEFTITKKDCK